MLVDVPRRQLFRSMQNIMPLQPVPVKELWAGGALNRKRTLITDDEVRTIIDEVIKSCDKMNQMFKAQYIPCRLDYTKLKSQIKNITTALRQACAPIKEGKFKGSLSNEHVLTVSNVCYYYFNPTVNNALEDLVIWGPCQGTKTMVFVFCFLILPALERLLHNRLAIPVINVPNYTNLQLSTMKELESVAKLYADIDLVHTEDDAKKPVSMSYVKTEILDNVLTGDNGATGWGNLVLQRNYGNLEAFIQSVVDMHEPCITINFTDEIHQGSKVDSVIDKWEKKFKALNQPFRRIGTTATPGELWGNRKWRLIKAWVFENYQGLITYNNMSLATISGKTPKKPRLVAIEERFPKFSEFLELDTLERESSFIIKKTCYSAARLSQEQHAEVKRLHLMYWQRFAKQLFDIYQTLVSKENPIFFIRPFARTSPCYQLLDFLSSMENDQYKILRYFGPKLDPMFGGAKNGFRTIKEVLIDEYVDKGRFCMVVAAQGRSRMGDSYPRQTAHFMDLVENSCSWDNIIQSTLGRSMGLNKNSTCYFRQTYLDSFVEFMRQGCREMSKPLNSRTEYTSEIGEEIRRGRPSKHRVIIFPNAK